MPPLFDKGIALYSAQVFQPFTKYTAYAGNMQRLFFVKLEIRHYGLYNIHH
jgi:hypothetical protein